MIIRPTLQQILDVNAEALATPGELPWEDRRSGGILYLLDYADATFTRSSEASAVDPRDGWAFYDLTTPWPGANVPRILPDGSILIEGSRTNVMLRSEELGNAAWSKSGATVADDTGTAPDGDADADTVEFGSTASARVFQNITGSADGETWTASLYDRDPGGGQEYRLVVTDRAGALQISSDIAPGAAWGRSSFTTSLGTGVSTPNLRVNNTAAGVAGDVEAWNVQAEKGAFPSSPIRTAGATATRAVESVTLTTAQYDARMRTDGFTFDIWPEYASSFIDGGGQSRLFAFGSSGDLINIQNIGGTARIRLTEGGVSRVLTGALVWSQNQKLTVTVKPNAGELTVSGATSGDGTATGTAFSWPANTITVSGTPGTLTVPFFGVVSRPRSA